MSSKEPSDTKQEIKLIEVKNEAKIEEKKVENKLELKWHDSVFKKFVLPGGLLIIGVAVAIAETELIIPYLFLVGLGLIGWKVYEEKFIK